MSEREWLEGLRYEDKFGLTFGECQGLCGRMVERVGWDSYCFECQEEMKAEQDETSEDLYDEDQFLYGGGVVT